MKCYIKRFLAIALGVSVGIVMGLTAYSYVEEYIIIEDKCKDIIAKPVIYLYPEAQIPFKVDLDYQGKLLYTYPKLIDVWEGIAYPDGTLEIDAKKYDYLFWEGEKYKEFDIKKGFVIEGTDTIPFLENKLSYLGLNESEINDFITYWIPQMESNPYNLIYFAEEDYTETAPLTIFPEPETMLRVFMVFKPLDAPIRIPEQQLKKTERIGFTVVEWGGTKLSK